MSTSRLLSFLTHCKDIALLMDCDRVLGLQLDSERASVWREGDKGKKDYKVGPQKWAEVTFSCQV